MSGKRFRIAFSFAGEKRDFVSKVASILAERFDQDHILYDKYHEAEFAEGKLGLDLPDLYRDQTDLVVVVVCPKYNKKNWCGLEWLAIHGMFMSGKSRDIMFCRFRRAKLQGLYENAGWIELDHKTHEETATLILERLAINEGKPKDHYTKPSGGDDKPLSTLTPNNLPRIQPFFGRDKELKAIREALDPENRTWGALIDGPGGMGKTSLAVRAAYDCPPDQFERIIFLSVKSSEMDDEGERKLTGFILPGFLAMLNELARELDRADITKATEDERIRLLLDALKPTRTLLILDNLESLTKDDRDQLFTLVKRLPQDCKAILTSRGRIGSGSEELILTQLDEPAALATLADLAQRNPLLAKTTKAERIALHQKTGGNPLLLRWVAGQLGRGCCRTLADALQFLNSCPDGNNPLEFVFGDLVNEFTPPETRVLCALTYFSLPVRVEHIAELAGLKKGPVETALRALANRSLVVSDQEEVLFALVPMVAEFLRRKRPEVVAETGDRLEKRAHSLIVENGFGKHDRFPVLDAAWPTVAASLPLFVAGPNDRLQAVCDALDDFLNFTGRWDEWISLSEKAETEAVTGGDHLHAGLRAYFAGSAYNFRQQADVLLACAERAEMHWREANAGAYERAAAVHLRGLWHSLTEDYASAITAHREALELARSQSIETQQMSVILNALAGAEYLSHDYEAAERDYYEALRVARAVDNTVGIASCTSNLALLALVREDWLRAEKLSREALSLAETMGRQHVIAACCKHLAQALAQQGKKADGLPYAQRAVEIFTRLRHPDLEKTRKVLRECEE